ncbi:MAG: histidine kinase [Acidobacteriaceae bacterium]|nr:histidine kinase [Acidobacteriaceae bacterium]
MHRYWICQLAGWLAYSAVGITINLLNGRETLGPLLAGHAVLIAAGIGLTHQLRRAIHRRRSPGQSIAALWPFLTTRAVAISLLLTALVIAVNRLLSAGSWSLVAAAALWWGMLLAVGVWVLLYVRFADQRTSQHREAQLQLALREAQLRALETQLNPHFLFNSLNSIRALVDLDPARAQDMLTRLSNVLRHRLRHDDTHTVPLQTELATVTDYLALETVRFAGRLRSAVTVDPAAAHCPIPPLLLQTLVENAIKHGIGRTPGPGDLVIQAHVEDALLHVAVENTGQLRPTPADSTRVGLQNLRERLHLLYGSRAQLHLHEHGDRVRATVALPMLG